MANATTANTIGIHGETAGGKFKSWLRRTGAKYIEARQRTAMARVAGYIDMLSDEQLAAAGINREGLK